MFVYFSKRKVIVPHLNKHNPMNVYKGGRAPCIPKLRTVWSRAVCMLIFLFLGKKLFKKSFLTELKKLTELCQKSL